MGILTRVNILVIEPNSRSNSYHALVGRPWGRKMKANISLDKDMLKIKVKGKTVIIPLHPRYGRSWDEPNNDDAYV